MNLNLSRKSADADTSGQTDTKEKAVALGLECAENGCVC